MSQLRFPLKTVLRSAADPAAIHRVQRRIDARLPDGARAAVPHRALAVLVALAAAGAAILAIVLGGGRRDAGPLRLANGASLAAVETAAAESRVSLSDGSEILLSPGSRLEPLEMSGSVFGAVLARGRATFDVRPGGPRRWMIECGLATVEVVGTRFACAREPRRLRVNVERGSVLVRGELVPDRARRLVMGESIEITAGAPAPAPSAPPTAQPSFAPAPAPAPAAAPVEPERTPAVATHAARPAERPAPSPAARTVTPVDPARATRDRAAGPPARDDAGVAERNDVAASRTTSAADLLALADRARIGGHPADAVAPLERILAEMPRDPQAPLAAFALGKLELDSLNRPRQAATAFRRALTLGLPASLEEEARVRLVDAYDRSGDPFAAQDAARDLLSVFPKSRHAPAMRARLAEP